MESTVLVVDSSELFDPIEDMDEMELDRPLMKSSFGRAEPTLGEPFFEKFRVELMVEVSCQEQKVVAKQDGRRMYDQGTKERYPEPVSSRSRCGEGIEVFFNRNVLSTKLSLVRTVVVVAGEVVLEKIELTT